METEKRQSKRKLVLQSIQYLLVPSIIEKKYEGVVTDISDSGLCLLTTSPLKDRQRIIIQDKSCSYEQAAIVRWSQKYDDMFFKIGLEFIEDQSFMYIRDKRRYKRFKIKNLRVNSKIASAHYVKIVDISLKGLLIETDKKWNIGEEYTLHVEYEGKQLLIKGYIVWSKLKDKENKEKTVPIYRAGVKFTSDLNEIREFLKFIELRLKQGEKNEFFSLGHDEADIQAQDIKCLVS